MILIMITNSGNFYPIEVSGKKTLLEEAKSHGELNDHVVRVETVKGSVLWKRTKN